MLFRSIVPCAGFSTRRSSHSSRSGRRGVPVTEALEQTRRSLDVGEQERHHPARPAARVPRARLRLAFLTELPVEEAERHDAVLLRGAQEAVPRAAACHVVLERDLLEARERVPHVHRVMYRKTADALRVDVRECAIRKTRAGARGELWQRSLPLHRQFYPRERRKTSLLVIVSDATLAA